MISFTSRSYLAELNLIVLQNADHLYFQIANLPLSLDQLHLHLCNLVRGMDSIGSGDSNFIPSHLELLFETDNLMLKISFSLDDSSSFAKVNTFSTKIIHARLSSSFVGSGMRNFG